MRRGLHERLRDFVEHVAQGELPKFAIGHELSNNLLVALHAVDDEALEGFLENVAEVVFRVRGGGFFSASLSMASS